MLDLIEEMVWGVVNVPYTGDPVELSAIANGATATSRHAVLNFTGSNSNDFDVHIPAGLVRVMIVKNANSAGADITIKYSGSSGVTLLNGTTKWIYCDGSEVYDLTGTATNALTLAGIAASSYARKDAFSQFTASQTWPAASLSGSASYAPDWETANAFTISFTGGTGTLNDPANPSDGQEVWAQVSGASMTTLNFDSAYVFVGGATPSYSGAGNIDLLHMLYEASSGNVYTRHFANMS